MSISCRSCGRRNRDAARFCDECGNGLSNAARVIGNRPVELHHGTFLFCDIVDSTKLANQLDLEDLRLVFRAFRDLTVKVSKEFGGHVHQYMGDGALLSFGYAETREDAEEASIRAGLNLVSAAHSARLPDGVRIELRVGVASGTVAGDVAAETTSAEDIVIGSVAHLAARLVAMAPPGGVVIAASTRRLAGDYFEYRDLGRLTLKGFPEPVQSWLVVRETVVASRYEARRLGRSVAPLLGRTESMSLLIAGWQSARQGRGRAFVLSGEAGMGKSRLARAVCDSARAEGCQVLEFDCAPSATHTPLHPVVSHVRRIIRARRTEPDAGERRLQKVLRRLLGPEGAQAASAYLGPLFGVDLPAPASEESPELRRTKIMSVLLELLQSIARRGPVVALVEDLHWADPTTLTLIENVCKGIEENAILLLVTTRVPAAIDGATGIPIEALPTESSERLVRQTPGSESLTAETVGRILERAEGNPLFIEELTRAVIERQGTEHKEAGLSSDIPDLIRSIISERLERHSSLKPFAQAASVLGRDFSTRLLTEMHPSGQWPDALARLIDIGVLTPGLRGDQSHLRFKHVLIQEAVYETMFRSERQQLHSRAAEALVQHFDGSPESAPDVLAHHLSGAGRFEEAVRALVRAGSGTAARAAYGESAGHCRAGLELVSKVPEASVQRTLQLQLLTSLGEALAATRGYATPEVESVYQNARSLCDEGVAADVLFPIVRGLGTFYFVRGKFGIAADIAATCLHLAEECARPDFVVEALSFRGYTCLYRGEPTEARTALERCLDLRRTMASRDLRYPSPQDAGTAAWSLLPMAAWLVGDAEAAENAVSEAIAYTERLSRLFDTAYVHVWIAMLRNMQRRFADAEHHAEECRKIAGAHGFGTWYMAATMHAHIARACQAPSEADVEAARDTLNMFIQAGAEASASFFLWGVAQGLKLLGRTAEAAAAVEEALRRAHASDEIHYESELLILQAELERDEEAGRATLREALRVAHRQRAIPSLTRAAVLLAQRTDAGLELPAGQRFDGLSPMPATIGPASSIVLFGQSLAGLGQPL